MRSTPTLPSRLHAIAVPLVAAYFAAIHLLGCGAQVSGSVGTKPTRDGRTEVDLCIGVIAKQAPQYLSGPGIAASTRKDAPQVASTPNGEPGL